MSESARTTEAANAERVLLLGAFRFPFVQGSQAFFGEQTRALRAAGAQVDLVSYGPGEPSAAERHFSIPGSLAPRSARSGLHAAKPLADLALARALVRSERGGPPPCAVLAHNVEALAVALLARRLGVRAPIVYVAHTLWEFELSAYVMSERPERAARLGRRIDRWAAAHCDALLALSPDCAERLEAFAGGPLLFAPPGLELRPPPSAESVERACTNAGLVRGGYALYSGNVDAYQDLAPVLALGGRTRWPVVVATFDRSGLPEACQDRGVKIVELREESQARALRFGAATHLVARRRPGGFPIKLLNAMETGAPVVAHEGAARCALVHDESAHLLRGNPGADDWARALDEMARNPERAAYLGLRARRTLEERHAWPAIAEQTLEFLRDLPTR